MEPTCNYVIQVTPARTYGTPRHRTVDFHGTYGEMIDLVVMLRAGGWTVTCVTERRNQYMEVKV